MLPGRNSVGVLQVAVFWSNSGDFRIFESLRVRYTFLLDHDVLLNLLSSDFFPVILTFLRQLPFVGQLLNLPYIRDVSLLPYTLRISAQH